MKKIIFLLGICLLVAGSVSAQGYYYGPRRVYRRPPPQRQRQNVDDFYKPTVGVTVGVNVANTVDYNYNYGTGTIAGLNAGLTFNVPLIYPLSFAPEVLFSQKGYSDVTNDGRFTQRSNFIDVPLLAKFRLVPGFNFLIGPQISFLLNTSNSFDNGFSVSSEPNYNYYGNKTFVDGVIGLSVDLNRYTELRARYTIDLNENDGYDENYVPYFRNQVWQFGVGFKFR